MKITNMKTPNFSFKIPIIFVEMDLLLKKKLKPRNLTILNLVSYFLIKMMMVTGFINGDYIQH